MKTRSHRKRVKANENEESSKNVKVDEATNSKSLVDLPNEVIDKQILPYLEGVDVLNLTQAGNSRLRNIAKGYIEGKEKMWFKNV
jgi:hypothetical protein